MSELNSKTTKDLRTVIHCLPIDPRTNRIVLILSKRDEDAEWSFPNEFKDQDDIDDKNDDILSRITGEQVGISGPIIGNLGQVFECDENNQPIIQHLFYELQIDEIAKKWPWKKDKHRRWFTLEQAEDALEYDDFYLEAIRNSSLVAV
ncbi:hypothetical protein K501DRAFT_338135 [Backusella circina FSU 941]|nr:hypothetical protein K501DRAFT_338135 [Backusella circina FSU 941]